MAEKNEQVKKRSWFEQNKIMLKFCGLFGLMVFLFFSAAQSGYARKTIAVWYPNFIANSVGKATSLIAGNVPKGVTPKFSDMKIENHGQIVRGVSRKSPRKTMFSMRIIYDCSGVFATSIYLAAVLAYPASMSENFLSEFFSQSSSTSFTYTYGREFSSFSSYSHGCSGRSFL